MTEDKPGIYAAVLGRMRQWYGESHITNGKSCLYWMHAGLVTLDLRGIRCLPAAGTAYFQIRKENGEDRPTHWGFEWEGAANSERVVLPCDCTPLPEMHCWIWLPTTNEVVDFSTGALPVIAKEMGYEWELPAPSQYVWDNPNSLLPRYVYKPSRDATRLAVATIFAGKKGTR